MESSASMRYVPQANVVARRLEDAVVLVHLDSSRIFTLNATGSRIWDLLTEDSQGGDPESLERKLRDEYNVDTEQLHSDVMTLLGQLEDERFVLRTDGGVRA